MSMNRSNDDLDALAARLRGLPELPVPAGLEARLLAAIPDAGALAPGPRRRRWGLLWLGGALAAAAVLLAVLLGSFFGKTDGPPDRPHPLPAPQAAAERPPTLGNYRLTDDAAPLPSFEWPVQLTVPVAGQPLPEEPTD
jgi:hypothetical protein